MFYMLDTDICSYIIKKRPLSVWEKFRKIDIGKIVISVITYAELVYGVERSVSKKINREIVEDFLTHLKILNWDQQAADAYAFLRDILERSGTPIGNMDLMIASHALSLKATLVTNNTKHFSKVKGLKIENWV